MVKIRLFNHRFLYETVIIVGSIMIILTLVKIFGFANFSSDWFWFIAGLGLTMEGLVSFIKQRTFDRKYKIVLRDNFKDK